MKRREAMKVVAVAATLPLHAAQEAPSFTPKFFTPAEFRLVEELTEIVIPTDDHSPGARAAKVAAYIDTRLAESTDPGEIEVWRSGLRRFLESPQDQWSRMLAEVSENEFEPKTLDERFFRELKQRTVRAYYTSDIGIHKEMEYKGNSYLDEFVGQ